MKIIGLTLASMFFCSMALAHDPQPPTMSHCHAEDAPDVACVFNCVSTEDRNWLCPETACAKVCADEKQGTFRSCKTFIEVCENVISK